MILLLSVISLLMAISAAQQKETRDLTLCEKATELYEDSRGAIQQLITIRLCGMELLMTPSVQKTVKVEEPDVIPSISIELPHFNHKNYNHIKIQLCRWMLFLMKALKEMADSIYYYSMKSFDDNVHIISQKFGQHSVNQMTHRLLSSTVETDNVYSKLASSKEEADDRSVAVGESSTANMKLELIATEDFDQRTNQETKLAEANKSEQNLRREAEDAIIAITEDDLWQRGNDAIHPTAMRRQSEPPMETTSSERGTEIDTSNTAYANLALALLILWGFLLWCLYYAFSNKSYQTTSDH